jgi:hypothetical protein
MKKTAPLPGLRLTFAALALAGLTAACSSPEVPPVGSDPSALSAEDYEASCAADGDCVTATFGEVCSLGCNPNGAIRSSEQARYLADLKERSADCPQVNYIKDPCEGHYRTIVAQCVSGLCTAVDVTDAQQDAGADASP